MSSNTPGSEPTDHYQQSSGFTNEPPAGHPGYSSTPSQSFYGQTASGSEGGFSTGPAMDSSHYQSPGWSPSSNVPPSYAGQPYPGTGQPYPGSPYPAQPSWQSGPSQERPSSATASAVLGIISGSLGLLIAVLLLIGTVALSTAINKVNPNAARTLAETGTIIFLTVAAIIAAIALCLLIGGISMLKGRRYWLLFVGAILQLLPNALLFLGGVANESETGRTTPIIIALIGLGLAISIIVTLASAKTKRWAEQQK